MENVLKTGYLKKGRQSNRLSVFRREPRRWYVFLIRDENQPFLEYYEDEESSLTDEPINSFELKGCQQVTYTSGGHNPSLTFCIVLPDRVIELTALTRSELIDWCECLERSLQYYGLIQQVRGTDNEHIYTDAPFLRQKKPVKSEENTPDDKPNIHGSHNDIVSANGKSSDGTETVPGMVLIPKWSRPKTIAVNLGEDLTSQKTGSLDRLQSPGLLVDEKDNSTGKANEISKRNTICITSSARKGSPEKTNALHKRIITLGDATDDVIKGSKGHSAEIEVDFFQLYRDQINDSKSENLGYSQSYKKEGSDVQERNLTDSKNSANFSLCGEQRNRKLDGTQKQVAIPPHGEQGNGKSSELTEKDMDLEDLDGGDYESLIDCNSHSKDSHNDDTMGLSTKPSKALKNLDENDNPTDTFSNLNTGKNMCEIGDNVIYSYAKDVTSNHEAIHPLSKDSSHLQDSTVEVGSSQISHSTDFTKVRSWSISECLPDDDLVRKNVKELLSYYDSNEYSGSGTNESSVLENSFNDNTQFKSNDVKKPFKNGDNISDVSQSTYLNSGEEILIPATTKPPQPKSLSLASDLSLCNSITNASPDLGYCSDKTLPSSPNAEQMYDCVPKRSLKPRIDQPPPVPRRSVISRQRPQTTYQAVPSSGEIADCRRPKRSLSVLQQVTGTASAQSVLPLKRTQAELLKQKITSPISEPVQLRRKDCLGTIAFVNAFGSVWIAGWNQRARPKLHGCFHLGDRLISINNQPVESATAANKFLKYCDTENVVFEVNTIPKAMVIAVSKTLSSQSLGLKRDEGTAEIIYVDPNGLSAYHGLPGRALAMDQKTSCSWTITEINNRPLNFFLKKNEVEPMLNAVGLNISFVVQPSDFIKELKKQLKHIRGYKDYLLN